MQGYSLTIDPNRISSSPSHASLNCSGKQFYNSISMGNKTMRLYDGMMSITDYEFASANFSSIYRRSMSAVAVCAYHLHSLWLFTSSDFKTIVGPSFVFGASNDLAGAEYGLESSEEALSRGFIQRLALVLLYVWMNLMPFTINNQKSPNAIKEDEMNLPTAVAHGN